MHWDGWSHVGWMWIWWILIIVALVFLIRWLVVQSSGGRSSDSPEQELKRRYARGEIDREEFQRSLEDLRR
jgi:putative membrane protein